MPCANIVIEVCVTRLCSIYLQTCQKIFQKGDHRLDNCECGYNCLTFLDSAFSNGIYCIFLTRTGSKIFPTSSLQDGDFSPQCIFKGYQLFIIFFIFFPDKDGDWQQMSGRQSVVKIVRFFSTVHFQMTHFILQPGKDGDWQQMSGESSVITIV